MSDSYTVPVLSFLISIIVATIAFLFINYFPSFTPNMSKWIIGIVAASLITSLAYGLSIIGSIFREYTMCKKVEFKSIVLSNTALLATVGGATFLLFLENIPIYKYIFGEYAPRDPFTGEEIPPETEKYKILMASEKHYKIQFFSNIVKAVLPAQLEEGVKDSVAYMYWVFWMTMLPSFFLFSAQGACA